MQLNREITEAKNMDEDEIENETGHSVLILAGNNEIEHKVTVTEKKVEENKMQTQNSNETQTKIYYGDNTQVTPVGNLDYNDFSKETHIRQQMPGFDSQYRDFVHYIMKITHNIWEEKGIGIIYDTYHNNCIMHAGSINIVGIKEVISGTLQTLYGFPDRRLIGQNVIWSPLGKNGFLSSHRVMSTATNLNDSGFGKATGRKVSFRTTIDCAVEENRIYEEWLVRDNLWIAIQLGLDVESLAKKMAYTMLSKQNSDAQDNYGLPEAMQGQLKPEIYTAKDDSIGEFMLEMVSRINNYKYKKKEKKFYHDNAVVHFICNNDVVGHNEIQGMYISLYASIPNASFEVDRVTVNQRVQDDGFDVAIRYRIRGLNEGIGLFGQPSGKMLELLGINHYHVVNNKIKEEWVTFDGLDVLRQKYMDRSILSEA